MKTVGLMLGGLLVLSLLASAGEVITNGTGEDATGLRVVFSSPVLVTAFGDVLTSVDPRMLSYEFTFSGGTVAPWDSHWLNYAPMTATILEVEWLQDTSAVTTSASSSVMGVSSIMPIVGLRVTFESPVTITGSVEVLAHISPTGKSSEFLLPGETLDEWVGARLDWTPRHTEVEFDWVYTNVSKSSDSGSEDRAIWERYVGVSMEEVIDQIAQYPKGDEPIYQPPSDEALWLTDSDGHIDIYDNDSIRINFAEWFDQSGIDRIDVYRNGIRMEFLPDMLDVVTNDQMKTFDGNVRENSPASSHTDHAIFGYEYRVRVRMKDGSVKDRLAVVKSRVRYSPDYAFANTGGLWWDDLGAMHLREFSYQDAVDVVGHVSELGFHGLSIGVQYFMKSHTANDLYSLQTPNPPTTPWWGARTPTEVELREMLSIIDDAGLQADVRLEIWVDQGGFGRSCIAPTDIDAYFDAYASVAREVARIADSAGADYFAPFTEMDSLMQYETGVLTVLDAVDSVFRGSLGVEPTTHWYLTGYTCDDQTLPRPLPDLVGTHWNWIDSEGKPLIAQLSSWHQELDTSKDQSLSTCFESYVRVASLQAGVFRALYPDNPLVFGEIGFFNYDGQAMGSKGPLSQSENSTLRRDDQEFADTWASALLSCAALGIDGLSAWGYIPAPYGITLPEPGAFIFNGTVAERIFRAIMGDGES